MDEVKSIAKTKMQKSIEKLKNDLSKIRTGRAHTGILDHLTVDYYGSQTAINQVANITVGDSVTINVQPYEKNMISVIEKAIREGDLGLNPATTGDIIRIRSGKLYMGQWRNGWSSIHPNIRYNNLHSNWNRCQRLCKYR